MMKGHIETLIRTALYLVLFEQRNCSAPLQAHTTRVPSPGRTTYPRQNRHSVCLSASKMATTTLAVEAT